MKKIYIAPEVKEHGMKLRHMLCASNEINLNINGDDITGDGGIG